MYVYPAHTYQHKKDLESLVNLKGVSWISALSKKIVGDELEDDFYLLNLMDNVLMTEGDFPKIHSYVDEACKVLGLQNKPSVFLNTSSEPKTVIVGEKKPMLVISSSIIELMSDEELKAVVAHEIAHLACRHSFYKILVENFSGITQSMSAIPGLTALGIAAKIPLYDWFRKADLSADRGALLVVKNHDVIIRMISKLAGGSQKMAEQVSQQSLLSQTEEVERVTQNMKDGSAVDKITYLFSSAVMNGIMRQHPWPSVRIREIRDWSSSEDYKNLCSGIFPVKQKESSTEKKPEDETGTFDALSSKIMFWKD